MIWLLLLLLLLVVMLLLSYLLLLYLWLLLLLLLLLLLFVFFFFFFSLFFFLFFFFFFFFFFLDASSHLYNRLCPSVRPSVGPSVRRSVRPLRLCKNRVSRLFLATVRSYTETNDQPTCFESHFSLSVPSVSPYICHMINTHRDTAWTHRCLVGLVLKMDKLALLLKIIGIPERIKQK